MTWGIHSSEDSGHSFLCFDTMYWCGRIPACQRTMLLSFLGWRWSQMADGGSMVLWNIGILPHQYLVSWPRRPQLELIQCSLKN